LASWLKLQRPFHHVSAFLTELNLDPPDASSDQAGISSRDEEYLLARRFILNPVLVIISLLFWFWMWGAPGAILSVPMLAITGRWRHLGTFWRDDDYHRRRWSRLKVK
jgi:hypothetical protein